MLILLDTNVLVSALLTPLGNAAQILDMIAEGKLIPVYCNRILDEYHTVLSRPRFTFPIQKVDHTLAMFSVKGQYVEPITGSTFMIHESDRIFLDTAITAEATLVTGNLKHYPNEPFIQSPANFISHVHK